MKKKERLILFMKIIILGIIAALFLANEYYLFKNNANKLVKSLNTLLTSGLVVVLNNINETKTKFYINEFGSCIIVVVILLALFLILVSSRKR